MLHPHCQDKCFPERVRNHIAAHDAGRIASAISQQFSDRFAFFPPSRFESQRGSHVKRSSHVTKLSATRNRKSSSFVRAREICCQLRRGRQLLIRVHERVTSRSFVFIQQLQCEWDRR